MKKSHSSPAQTKASVWKSAGSSRRKAFTFYGSRDEARRREATAMLVQNGAQVEAVVVDVAAPATFETARKLIEDRFGRLDVLINNAGIGARERPTMSEEILRIFVTRDLICLLNTDLLQFLKS